MADFCRGCGTHIFGEEHGDDMAGLLTKEESDKGLVVITLCECCGPCQVDYQGNRRGDDYPVSCECYALTS